MKLQMLAEEVKNSKAPKFKVIPNGTEVTWVYRGGIGHGVIIGVHKMGTTEANTEYSIRQHDHHDGEPDVVFHFGSNITRV